MLKNSLKQLIRQPVKCLIFCQPVKCLLFFLLLTAATALVIVGLVLSMESAQRIQAVEDNYTTIGTVHQGPVGTDVSTSYTTCWGASFDETEVSAPAIPLEVLNFPGADYVIPPEKRPYFISYLPELNHQEYNTVDRHILEFTPVAPFEEGAPTEVEVTRVFSSDINEYSANIRGGNGLNLEAVYENGKLTGVRESQEKGFVESGAVINAEAAVEEGDGASGETIAEHMERYAPYGVSYQERDGRKTIRYKGRAVKSFSGLRPDGGVFSVGSTDGGESDLATVYDRNGKLCGVRVVET